MRPTRPGTTITARRLLTRSRGRLRLGAALLLAIATLTAGTTGATSTSAHAEDPLVVDNDANTTTPIKHVVVLYDENESFDHYFGTYPYATNADGTPFHAASDTPTDIDTELAAGLLPGREVAAHNPNAGLSTTSRQYLAPNPNSYQPVRIAPNQALTCDQNHGYGAEEQAADDGAMDTFVESTNQTCSSTGTYSDPGLVMDYYDGNTVTALWNYAQHYAMSDNSWDAVYGPSTPGALDLISGNTYSGTATINSDVDPNGDTAGGNAAITTPTMQGANVGDLLNDKGVSWGWFQGGFTTSHSWTIVNGQPGAGYSAHHDPFQYYASTSNPAHTPPTDGAEVGHSGAANHSYDLDVFNDIFSQTPINGTVPDLPAVSYLKAPMAQDAHPGNSDPLDEQVFLTTEINAIEQSAYWPSTAIVIAYDDSDGWYDHVAPVITNSSDTTASGADAGICTSAAASGVPALDGQSLRCGPSQRLPLLVISPYAKQNYVSHTLTTQVSILRFIEDNWSTGQIDTISSVPGSFDATANGLDDMFDFAHPQADEVLLNSTLGSARFGAVTATPTDPVAPVGAPVITVTHPTVTLPVGSAVPSASALLTDAGASINHGQIDQAALTASLAGVDPTTVGDYPVTLTGTDSADPQLPATPVTVIVRIAPYVALAHPSLTIPAGAVPDPSDLLTQAGATLTGATGTVTPPDLTGVDFSGNHTYQVPITATATSAGGSELAVIPATLSLEVQQPAARVSVKPAASRTTLHLADTSLRRTQRPRLTIGVAARGVRPAGHVRIYDGTRLLRTVTLRTAQNGTVKVRLTALRPGSHRLKAQYAASRAIGSSSSRTITVRVRS